jgi:hypothetical protein
MKNLATILFVLLIPSILNSQAIKDYQQLKVFTVAIGSAEGQMVYDQRAATLGSLSQPLSFTIGNDNNIYINDSCNARINIYDINFAFKKTINDKKHIGFWEIRKIEVDDENNLFLYIPEAGLVKIDLDGNIIWRVKKKELPVSLRDNRTFFLYEKSVVYFDSQSAIPIKFIDENGIVLDDEKNRSRMETLYTKTTNNIEQVAIAPLLADIEHAKMKELNIFENKGNMLAPNISMHREYFKKIKNQIIKKQDLVKDKAICTIDFSDDAFLIDNKLISGELIGYDVDNNSYWKSAILATGKTYIIILRKNGSILDAFYFDIERSFIAVAPNGDVYFMQSTDAGINFYKTIRQW